MIKLSDYVVEFLIKKGIKNVFLVAGGGIMHLLDSVGRNKNINYIANHHEQASAIAAESYSRLTNDIGVCLVTTGPGGTNAITGVAGAWVDSIPVLVISGQVKRELIADYKKVRQIGPQEINIVDMVKGITKYAKTIMEPESIKYELEKAYYEAKSGRPGPVWLNIPLDVQSAMVDEKKMIGFIPPKKQENEKYLSKKIDEVIELLQLSKTPIIIAGNGIRLSGGLDLFIKLINKLKIPVVLPFNGLDLLPENDKYLIGKFGPGGQRRGNFALQNADLVLSIGASLNVSSTGFDYKNFAYKAKIVMVNIDGDDLDNKKINVYLPIEADAKCFIEKLLKNIKNYRVNKKWTEVCKSWKKNYPSITKDYFKDKNHVNSYVFCDVLSDFLKKKDPVVTGIALDACSLYQAFKVKNGQRAFVNKNFGQMGWDLPAAIGACFANGKKRTICVAGDGSIQLNIQELETIKYYKLPIKIFIFNNGGYESIRATQENLFNGNFVGADKNTGLTNPDFKFLSLSHHIKYEFIRSNKNLKDKIQKVLNIKGPVLCEVNISYFQKRTPKASSYIDKDGYIKSKPLEDMYPFLSEDEIWKNMHIFNKDK